MTRQRTLILTRTESSDWGRRDAFVRRTDNIRYWLLVPFYSYVFMFGSGLYMVRTLASQTAHLVKKAAALSKAIYPEIWEEGQGPS